MEHFLVSLFCIRSYVLVSSVQLSSMFCRFNVSAVLPLDGSLRLALCSESSLEAGF